MRADRLLSLALLLQARGRTSARDLAEALEVSVRTVYRDIAALNAAGVPVLAEPGPNGGCALVEGYRFALRGLTPEEAEALLVLGAAGVAADLGLAGLLEVAQRKVRTSAGAAGQPTLVHLDLPRWFQATEPVPLLPVLAEGVRRGRRLVLSYRRNGAGAPRDRTVDPLGLVNKAGTWYLVATRSAPPGGEPGFPVVYRAGRVTGARLGPEPAVRPGGFDLAAFWVQWSDEFARRLPQVEVRVRASPPALGSFPEVFGELGARAAAAAEAAPDDRDGWRTAQLSFESERAAAHRLAGFGGELEVLSPPAVRGLLAQTARELLGRYAAG